MIRFKFRERTNSRAGSDDDCFSTSRCFVYDDDHPPVDGDNNGEAVVLVGRDEGRVLPLELDAGSVQEGVQRDDQLSSVLSKELGE